MRAPSSPFHPVPAKYAAKSLPPKVGSGDRTLRRPAPLKSALGLIWIMDLASVGNDVEGRQAKADRGADRHAHRAADAQVEVGRGHLISQPGSWVQGSRRCHQHTLVGTRRELPVDVTRQIAGRAGGYMG